MKKIISLFTHLIQSRERNLNLPSTLGSFALTYNQYDSISDQEVEFWESVEEPWNYDSERFWREFPLWLKTNGGDTDG